MAGRPPKESQESKVLTKLKMFTKKDQELMFARFAEMLELLTSDIVKGRGEMGQVEKVKKVPTKKAAAKAADKKAAEDAMTKAVVGAPEPYVKEVAAGSAVTFESAPEESLHVPQIAEPKEAEVIVAAVVQVGAIEEVNGLKLAIETLGKKFDVMLDSIIN